MKLIIDVPDKVFKRLVAGEIQYGGFTARNIFNSVKEGIPYEERPQGDSISREALKKAIKTECNPYGKPTIDFESGKRVLDIIDNAPSVNPCKNCDLYFKAMTKEEMKKGGAE